MIAYKNANEICDLISTFNELNGVYDKQFSLYLDSDRWDLFDTRVCRSILNFPYKKYVLFTNEMRTLMFDIVNVGCVSFTIARGRKPKLSESNSIRRIIKIYGIQDTYFFNNQPFKNYLLYGFNKKEKDLADCY